jgi:hypothetical protein
MSGSHGDLFHEIGKLVLAAHAGQAIDLSAKSEELAERYVELGMPADLIAKAIARSLGAISVSMAVVANGHHNGNGDHATAENGHGTNGHANGNGHAVNGHRNGNGHSGGDAIHLNEMEEDEPLDARPVESQAEAASTVFPSGLRLAVLS